MKISESYNDENGLQHLCNALYDIIDDKTLIVCIGTDMVIGDSLGPIIGSKLIENNFPLMVFGTLDKPIHAMNIEYEFSKIKNSYPNYNIIGIDASLTYNIDNIGKIFIKDKPIKPGAGVDKDLIEVGDYSIAGVVDIYSEIPITSRYIRLNFIMKMAESIIEIIQNSYYKKINKAV
jgi:putative sporulation protein YyaC